MNDNQDLKTKQFTLRPDDLKSWNRFSAYITQHDVENLGITVTHLGKIRTLTQNGCIHRYCEWLAKALNEGGFYRQKKLFGVQVELPWTMASVKEDIWHIVQFSMYPHAVIEKWEPSTTKLNSVEVGEIYKIISQNIAAERGINVPWPSLRG